MQSHRVLNFIFVFLLTLTLVSAVAIDNPNIPIVKPLPTTAANVSNETVNQSRFWDTTDQGPIDSVGDIMHSLLDQLAWSIAGHFFDTHVDVNGYDLYNITNVNATNIWATYGNFTSINVSNNTIWIGNQRLTSNTSELLAEVFRGGEVFAGEFAGDGHRITNLTLNNTLNNSLAIVNVTIINNNITSPEYFGGNYTGDNFSGTNAFFENYDLVGVAPNIDFDGKNISLGENLSTNKLNLTCFNETCLNVSGDIRVRDIYARDGFFANNTVHIGGIELTSPSPGNLSVVGGNVTATYYYGSGQFLTDINLSNISFEGDTINATTLNADNFNGGNFTGNNFTGDNAFFDFYNWVAELPWLIFNGTFLQFNESYLNQTVNLLIANATFDMNLTNVALTNQSNTFQGDQVFNGNISAASYNWTASSPWLEFNGSNLEFNSTHLGGQLDNKVNRTGDTMLGDLNISNNSLHFIGGNSILGNSTTGNLMIEAEKLEIGTSPTQSLLINGSGFGKMIGSTYQFGFFDNASFVQVLLGGPQTGSALLDVWNNSAELNIQTLGNKAATVFGPGGIMPETDLLPDIGEPTRRWRSLYVENITVHDIFAGSYNWTASAPWLIFNGSNLEYNESYLNQTVDTLINNANITADMNLTNIALTNQSNVFQGNQTINGSLFASSYNWTASAPWLIFNGSNLEFNESNLNETLNITNLWEYNSSSNTLHPKNLSHNIGVGTAEANASVEIKVAEVNVTEAICDDAIRCYRFEEGMGEFTEDSSLSRKTGYLRGPNFTASKGGNGTGLYSTHFHLTDSYIYAPNNPNINITDNFSISLWITRMGGQDDTHSIISKLNTEDSQNGYYLRISGSGRPTFVTRDGGSYIRRRTVSGETIDDDDEWYHLVVTKLNGAIEFYINGVNVANTTTSTSLPSGDTTALILGINPNLASNDHEGQLDEVTIFPGVLNQTQVTDIFQNGVLNANSTVVKAKDDYFRIGAIGESGDTLIVDNNNFVGISTPTPEYTLDVNGSARVERTLFVEEDLIVDGVLIGGSPVKVAGGLEVRSGDLELIEGNIEAENITVNSTVIAHDYVDLTPAYNKTERDASDELKLIDSKDDGQGGREVDHDTYPDFAIKNVTIINETTGLPQITKGRSIGALVSVLIEAFQDIIFRLEKNEVDINHLYGNNTANQNQITTNENKITTNEQQIADLVTRVDVLEQELCSKDPSYSFCSQGPPVIIKR